MKRLFAAVGGVITLVGAIPIAIGAAELWERSAHWRAGAHAEGFVISAERLRLRELISPFSRSVYEVEYEFRTPSGAVRTRGIYRAGRLAAPEHGQPLRVSYLRDDPSSSIIEDAFTAFDAGLLLAAGLLIWIGGAVFLWPELRGRRAGPR